MIQSRRNDMDYLKRLIALLVCSTQITTFAEDSSITTDHFSTEESVNSSVTREISVTPNTSNFLDFTTNLKNMENVIDEDIQALVYSSVASQLQQAGFETGKGLAFSDGEENNTASGLYYYDSDFEFFEDDNYQSVGFLEIVEDSQVHHEFQDGDVIAVKASETSEQEEEILKICTYQYDSIGSSHFVYKNQYITYYQQTDMEIIYSVQENDVKNYDLSLGSLYDYDNKKYIYDETIFSGEYQNHSATGLFSTTDYIRLEETMQKISAEQEKNGYSVTEYSIVYVSPENIQAYINSQEEDMFFDYSVQELTETFGIGTTLRYTEGGFEELASQTSDWKTFLSDSASETGAYITSMSVYSKKENLTFTYNMLSLMKEKTIEGLLKVAVQVLSNAIKDGFQQSLKNKAKEVILKDVLTKALQTVVLEKAVPSIGGMLIAGVAITVAGSAIKMIKNSKQAETICTMKSHFLNNHSNIKSLSETFTSSLGYQYLNSLIDGIEKRDIDSLETFSDGIANYLKEPKNLTRKLKLVKNNEVSVTFLAKNSSKMVKCTPWVQNFI